jgi:hypothetical protein
MTEPVVQVTRRVEGTSPRPRLDRQNATGRIGSTPNSPEKRMILSVDGNHFDGSEGIKSAFSPEGKMNNRESTLQQDKKVSKKGRLPAGLSSRDE